MTRRAPIPFDPDSAGGAVVVVHAAPQGELMLSQVIDQADWHGDGNDHTVNGYSNDDSGPGTSKPLDNKAKWRLSDLAERAFKMLDARGLLAGEKLKDYRGRIAVAACGKRISDACIGDRLKIQAAFLREMGRAEEASRVMVKAKATATDIALFKIRELCGKRSYPEGYAERIAFRIYKRPLDQLATKEVWTVFYSINNNANKRDRKGHEANRWKKLKAQRNAKKSL